jgi:two-component system chemotaxis sensor kinase CheA
MPVPNEIIQEFLVETHDGLGRLDLELVELEKGEAKSETLGSVFRTMHSLKGSAGFLGFQKLESLTHVAESLLSRLRDGKLSVTVEIVSALLATIDAVREMLRSIELTGQDGDQLYSELIGVLRALTVNEPASAVRSVTLDERSFDLASTQSVRMTAPLEPVVQKCSSDSSLRNSGSNAKSTTRPKQRVSQPSRGRIPVKVRRRQSARRWRTARFDWGSSVSTR